MKVNYNNTENTESLKKNVVENANYNQQHLRNFLLSHPAINIAYIENSCSLPDGTLRHFMKNRRNIPLKYFEDVKSKLSHYGYTGLDSE